MKNILFAIVGFALLCVASCCKPGEKECEIVPIVDVMKDYVFDVGSYWVYQDDSTGNIDTISIVAITDSVVRVGKANYFGDKNPQFVKTDFYRSGKDLYYSEGINTTVIFRTADYNGHTICYLDSNTYSQNCSQGVFSYATIPNINITFGFLAIYASYSVSGKNYLDVRQFWSKGAAYNSSCSPFDLETYYSPSVGLIKFTETETNGYVHSYSLISYNAEPFALKTYCHE